MELERVPDLFPSPPLPAVNGEKPNSDEPRGTLAIRKSAVLDTGRRQVTYRKRPDGAYELAELKIGPLAEGKDKAGQVVQYYPVLSGLNPGDEVVVQGGFLMDSQRQIEGMPSLLYTEGRSAASLHAGHGGGTASPTSPPAKSPASPTTGGHKH
jgi:hypothetical protein